MDSAIDGMAILNGQGEHIYANAAFARMVGQDDHQQLLGMKWEQVYDPRDVRMNVDEIRRGMTQEGRWSGPILLHQPDGRELPIEMSITRLPDGGVVCVSRDVRDRRDAENARFQAETKYKALVERVAAVSYIAELGVEGQWLYVSPQIETILGFALALLIGIPLAVFVANSRLFNLVLYPILVATQSIPKVAIAPRIVVSITIKKLMPSMPIE